MFYKILIGLLLSSTCFSAYDPRFVVANSAGLKVVAAQITNSAGTPTMTNDYGTDWVSSLSDLGTGNVGINVVAGVFTVAPSCTCMILRSGGECTGATNTFSTTSYVEVFTKDPSGTVDDRNFEIICVGTK